jgi:hypothetical protein
LGSLSRGVLIAVLCSSPIFGAAVAGDGASDVKLTASIPRGAYYRGEDVPVSVTVANATAVPIHSAALSARIGGREEASTELGAIAAGGKVTRILNLSTARLKAGRYQVRVTLADAAGTLATTTTRMAIGRRPNPERLKVWLWGGGGDLNWYPRHGFTSCGGPSWQSVKGGELPASVKRHLDNALMLGLDANIAMNGGLRERDIDLSKINDPEAVYKGPDNRVKLANPFHPEVAKQQNDANRRLMEAVKDYPQIRTSFFNTEVVDRMWGIANEAAVELMKQTLGFSHDQIGDPKYVAPGVIADDDRGYLFRKYIYKTGNGLVMANKRVAEMLHRYRPDILAITDPYRVVALYGLFDGLDCIETWTYTNPDPKLMLYIETLRAACKPARQIPINTVTMLNYPGELAPTDEWMLMDAGRLKVTTWINLSRAPAIVGYYYSSECNPVGTDTFKTPYSTSAALKELADRVFRPYGPMIGNLQVCPRRIAVLSSEAARLYGESPRLRGGYGNMQIYHFYSVMAMAHLQADVVFDETLERYGLDGYDVLVLPKCDVLPKAVYDKILEFQKRGGVVIADQYLGPKIPGAITFDFDFTYRDKVSAKAIAENKAYAKWDDHLEPGSAELKTVEGVTALDDQKIMESYAARLKAGLAGKVEPDVDCDEPTVLFDMLEHGGAKYLVIINDKRTYDERLGKYKAVLGKVLPQTVTVSLKKWDHPGLCAYDMLAREALPVTSERGARRFTVDLTDIGGTIIALYPEPVQGIAITAPAKMTPGAVSPIKVTMRAKSGALLAGLQPVQITITDPHGRANEFSDYYCAKGGVLKIPFAPALNDSTGRWKIRALDLTCGKTAEASFKLAR